LRILRQMIDDYRYEQRLTRQGRMLLAAAVTALIVGTQVATLVLTVIH
jgi:hypothetical protein